MATTGVTIGLFRGTRRASLQFLAENAHRAPTTLQGWYFYNKTKNYRMILGGLRQGGVDGIRMGLTGLGWVAFEQGMRRGGLDDVREIGAAIGTAATFSALCESWQLAIYAWLKCLTTARLPWIAARRAMLLGLLAGTTMRVLRLAKERMQEADRQPDAAAAESSNSSIDS